MNSTKIPNKTQLLVKSDKLRKAIQNFSSNQLNDLTELDKEVLSEKIKRDGFSIITNFLGYNNFEENQFEFALAFVWNIEFTSNIDLSSIEIIDKWGYFGK